MKFSINIIFFTSILLSIMIWGITIISIPVDIIHKVHSKTILFVIANYLALISGYFIFNLKNKYDNKQKVYNIPKIIKLFIILSLISYIIRFIDLFIFRELSFQNTIIENLKIVEQSSYNLVFVIASIFKSLYFFPVVILIFTKEKQKTFLSLMCYLMLFLPVIEALLRGTRKPFFELFLILMLSFIVSRKIKINNVKILGFLLALGLLLLISNRVLYARQSPIYGTKDFYAEILKARYNEFLPPKEYTVKYMTDREASELGKQSLLTFVHIGQYITHGFYELNYIMEFDNLPITYGGYTFNSFRKFFGLPYKNPSPREYMYLTAFGDFYLDFRWLTIVVMFLFGIFQKYVFTMAKQSLIWLPLMIYILVTNLFLLILNYLSGAGIYPFIGFILALIMLNLPILKLYEKGLST